MMINIKNLSLDTLKTMFDDLGEPSFRWRQVMKWTYRKRLDSFDGMSDVAKTSRAKLAGCFSLEKLPLRVIVESASCDAVKFGFEIPNGIVESVLLIDGDRRTACLSSQLGCSLGCTFCETGRSGFIRNLTQEEIVGQLIGINDFLSSRGDKPVTNIVFMGMGEALLNYENFRSSLDIIMADEGFGIGGRKITVSTAGVVPSIERLLGEDFNIGLAISLNAYCDEERNKIMPINRKYPIASLIEIAYRYFQKTGRRVTFEYVVVEGENDTQEAVDALASLLNAVTCKINVIPLNPYSRCNCRVPDDRAVGRFAQALRKRGLSATVRTSRGRDIMAACGQLRATLLPPRA